MCLSPFKTYENVLIAALFMQLREHLHKAIFHAMHKPKRARVFEQYSTCLEENLIHHFHLVYTFSLEAKSTEA